jgi:hypothetical protein
MTSGRSARLQAYLQRYRLDGELPESFRPTLEALRYREENLAIKAGATLGFCGLMIASILVQMAAPSESMIFVSRESPWSFFAIWGLMLLLLASFMTLVAITWGRPKYSDDTERALGELTATIAHKRLIRGAAGFVCLAGAICAAVCLMGPLLAAGAPALPANLF